MKKLMSSKEYHARPEIGSTLIKKIHAKSVCHAISEEDNDSDDRLLGRYLHTLLLEPETVHDYIIMPECDRRTKEGKEIYQIFLNSSDGKTVLKKEMHDTAIAMCVAVMTHPLARNMIIGGEAEYSYFSEDKETGLSKKTRPDYKKNNALIDIKSAADAGYEEFSKQAGKLGYHLQAAYYLDVHNEATGENIKDFFFIVAEKKPPYAVAVYQLNELDIDAGRQAYRAALNEYADYLRRKNNSEDLSQYIHGYPPVISMLSIPHWYHNKIKVGR